jgi:hypothetical protein
MPSEIKIPFNPWSKKRLREGVKWSTSRTKIYGKEGDYFHMDGKDYEILGVVSLPTEAIIRSLYLVEGAESPEELRNVLNSIFRGKEFPYKLWIHFFREIDGDDVKLRGAVLNKRLLID